VAFKPHPSIWISSKIAPVLCNSTEILGANLGSVKIKIDRAFCRCPSGDGIGIDILTDCTVNYDRCGGGGTVISWLRIASRAGFLRYRRLPTAPAIKRENPI